MAPPLRDSAARARALDGDPARLDRDLSNPFGSEGYAREELRAEIASLILGAELGIGYDPDRHAGYVDHWVQILTDTPKEILYAAADAERISEYILTIERKKEKRHTQEVGTMKKDIPHTERTYLAVPYAERHEAKALGARWDAVKKAWYVGPEADRGKIEKWEPKHQPAPTLDPRTEFAAVLREIGAMVEGEHPIMNGEAQRIPAVNDKRGRAHHLLCCARERRAETATRKTIGPSKSSAGKLRVNI
jgi:putative DNA primase/helicase